MSKAWAYYNQGLLRLIAPGTELMHTLHGLDSICSPSRADAPPQTKEPSVNSNESSVRRAEGEKENSRAFPFPNCMQRQEWGRQQYLDPNLMGTSEVEQKGRLPKMVER